MSGAKRIRCEEGYGIRSMRLLRAAKERGMHLNAAGAVVMPSGKIAGKGRPYFGRYRINVGIDGESCTMQAARVVCFLAYGEPPTTASVADHIDGNTLDDRPSNLRWATYSENTRNTAYSRTKTREQLCVEACEGLADPSAVPEMLAALRMVWQSIDQVNHPAAEAVSAVITRAEGRP